MVGEVAAIATRLRAAGFDVTRVKLEAVVTNEGVPDTEEEVQRFPAGNYFEFHVKTTLPAVGADLEALRARCERHGAHLSRNARKVREDGASERFVTLRVKGLGRLNADARFKALRKKYAEYRRTHDDRKPLYYEDRHTWSALPKGHW